MPRKYAISRRKFKKKHKEDCKKRTGFLVFHDNVRMELMKEMKMKKKKKKQTNYHQQQQLKLLHNCIEHARLPMFSSHI